jgi:hypothetical protein
MAEGEREMTNESYPSCFQHCTIHLNPDTGEMHSDGDHRVRAWVENKITALKQQIEDMQRCGNCKHIAYDEQTGELSCENDHYPFRVRGRCDNWIFDGRTRGRGNEKL